MYYHVLEYGNYGQVGYQGCYDNLKEAEAEVIRLSNFFPDASFHVYVSADNSEPPIVNV